jgi:transcriptional regulator with XRE-family HTH domain
MVLRYRFFARRSRVLRLTIERKRRGLSQAQLARLADIHPATLSRLEAGKVFAYGGWRRRLERVLGVSGDELFVEVAEQDVEGGSDDGQA